MNNKLILVGTTHLMKAEEIEEIIKIENPDIIGVELCKTRLNLMVLNQPQELNNNPEGIIEKISQSIKKKAEEENLQYGSDMITASRYAINNNIQLECIDKDILEIKRLMNLLPLNEQIGFLNELMVFEQKTLKEQVENLDEEKVLLDLRTKYPIAFEFLVSGRDLFIAFNILKLSNSNPHKKILIFMGKGHLKSISDLLSEKEVKI